MPLLRKVRQLAIKTETTIGTDASLGNANVAFNAWDIDIKPDISPAVREAQSQFGNIASVMGMQSGTATFKTDMIWDGTTTEPAWASTLLPACGWVASGSDPTIYYPESEAPGSNVKTVTIGVYENGKIRKLTGAMGSFKINLIAGDMCFIEWEFKGAYSVVADGSMLTQTAVSGTVIKFAGASACSWNSVELAAKTIVIDSGNELTPIEKGTATGGVLNYLVTNRVPKITCDPEAVLAATQDRESLWLAGTEHQFITTLDTPTNSSLSITAPKAQIISIPEGDRNGIITDEIEFQCNKNGSTVDQELYLTFTAAS
jgi:hypothetical protein